MRVHHSIASSLVVAALLSACSTTSSDKDAATGSVTGSVTGTTLSSASATASAGDFFQASTGTKRGLRILISNKANTCSLQHWAESTNLDVRIRGESIGPGTYSLVDSVMKTPGDHEAEADFNAVDEACKDVIARPATSGTITLTRVEINVTDPALSRVSGSVAATFDGGHVEGEFEAVLCDEQPAAGLNTPTVACTP